MMLPPEGRLLRFLFRDRDFDDLIDVLSSLWLSLRWRMSRSMRAVNMWPSDVLATDHAEGQSGLHPADVPD